jgi:glycosyltransferase involved in cell wall biosynthesis
VSAPLVSVVLGVRDGADTIAEAVASVLAQEGPALELIAVDDGSTDATGARLRELAAGEPRLRIVEQPPVGLTAALARGCALARGRYLARQDAADRSLPGRLARQVGRLEAEPERVLVACGTRVLAPGGEPLYEVVQDDAAVHAGLAATRAGELRGPVHGSVVFRRDAYEAAGGYRAEFRVAQDLDLWLRLAERGAVGAVPEILYEARLGYGSISSLAGDRQRAAARLALAARRRRAAGEREDDLLARARRTTSGALRNGRRQRAATAYFFACCLETRDPQAALRYLGRALAENPLALRAWLRRLRIRG